MVSLVSRVEAWCCVWSGFVSVVVLPSHRTEEGGGTSVEMGTCIFERAHGWPVSSAALGMQRWGALRVRHKFVGGDRGILGLARTLLTGALSFATYEADVTRI